MIFFLPRKKFAIAHKNLCSDQGMKIRNFPAAPAVNPVFDSFLRRQHEEGMRLANDSELLTLVALAGNPPTEYLAEFRCKGLSQDPTGTIVELSQWVFGIRFPEDYLRQPVHPAHVLTYLGPCRTPYHPNLRAPYVCLNVTTGMALTEILYGLHEILTWNLFDTHDEGLNHSAAQWARNQPPGRFPIDRRPLKRNARAHKS